MTEIYIFIAFLLGFGLNEYAHRERRRQDQQAIENLLQLAYWKAGFKPKEKVVQVETETVENAQPGLVPHPTFNIEPPSIEAMRAAAR